MWRALGDYSRPRKTTPVFRCRPQSTWEDQGLISSPFILNATVLHHLDQYETDVSQDMQDNLYVDDVFSGCDTEDKAISYYHEAISIMHDANFNLRTWASNSSQLHTQATADNVADPSTNVSLLGLRWNPSADIIYYASKDMPSTFNALITKCEVLQDLCKVYDPLGYIAAVLIKAKIFMQELWKQ